MHKMKIITTIILLTILAACSNEKTKSEQIATVEIVETTSESNQSINPVVTGNDLIDKLNEIKNLPFRTLPFDETKIDSISWNCGDSLYWKIVQLGQEAIPYLITKVQDSSLTNIQIPCRESKLTVGTIAFMALDEIISIPYSFVFEIQWDVLNINCDFGYPIGLLEYMNTHPKEAHEKLTKWYEKNKKTIKKVKLNSTDQNDCQKEYGLDYKLTINY